MFQPRFFRGIVAAAALLLLLITSSVNRLQADDAVEADLKALAGSWTSPGPDGAVFEWEIEGKLLKLTTPNRKYTITLALDPKAQPNKTVDFKVDEGPEDAKGKTLLGIYKVEGADKVTFCAASGENVRPEKFEQVGQDLFLFELKRKP